MKILWVENHERFIRAVRQQFLAGHELTVTPSLEAAREALAQETFDVALIDFDLDDGKGDALVRELRQTRPGLRIIATSAHADGNRALAAAGAEAVCGKLEFARIAELLTLESTSRAS